MLNRIAALSLPLFALALTASSAQAVTLNLEKFRNLAREKLAELVDLDSEVTGNARVIFVDGASSIDQPPANDLGAFYYEVKTKAGILPIDDATLAFRLSLAGSTEIVLVKHAIDGNVAIANLTSGNVAFKEGASDAEKAVFIEELRETFRQATVDYFDALGMFSYEVPFRSIRDMSDYLRASDLIQNVELNLEVYPIMFQIDKAVTVKKKGTIDADYYRGTVKELKNSGVEFVTETTVPEELQ
jgi:hypothetical protein